ncbi:hypothetical protein E2C01_029703 [Portunus trituberculatus]|uniref:Uncharacterized protein n=1 Tax=Portunus trituberculatus TaxID=210409 RepID=A0A5B7EQ17_PORTR|nr:hypothetical protein [Portunus trituberculatus]
MAGPGHAWRKDKRRHCDVTEVKLQSSAPFSEVNPKHCFTNDTRNIHPSQHYAGLVGLQLHQRRSWLLLRSSSDARSPPQPNPNPIPPPNPTNE